MTDKMITKSCLNCKHFNYRLISKITNPNLYDYAYVCEYFGVEVDTEEMYNECAVWEKDEKDKKSSDEIKKENIENK